MLWYVGERVAAAGGRGAAYRGSGAAYWGPGAGGRVGPGVPAAMMNVGARGNVTGLARRVAACRTTALKVVRT